MENGQEVEEQGTSLTGTGQEAKRETSLWWLVVPVATVLIGAILIVATSGIVLIESDGEVCATEPFALPSPTTPDLLIDALEQLIEVGIVPSREAAAEAIAGAQYIFDPDEESQLEYWVMFRSGSGMIAAEFNFSCPLELETEGYPLNIKYEGVRGL